MVTALFPSVPFSPREIDSDFAEERSAASQAGLETALIDHSSILKDRADAAVVRVPEGAGAALYRGWMLNPTQYSALYLALQQRGVKLINTPEAYLTCHYLPESYPLLDGHTPKSAWIPVAGAVDLKKIAALLEPFGGKALVLKDYVKSQKHYWVEACFIPAANDIATVERVIRRFMELQGDDLNEGLVFREYVPLKRVGTHPKSGLPLAAEFRIFWLDGAPLLVHRYWGNLVEYQAELPLSELREIVVTIPSRFFTMDIAFCEGGGWTIVELGDGQVAGLPDQRLAGEFFCGLGKSIDLLSNFAAGKP